MDQNKQLYFNASVILCGGVCLVRVVSWWVPEVGHLAELCMPLIFAWLGMLTRGWKPASPGWAQVLVAGLCLFCLYQFCDWTADRWYSPHLDLAMAGMGYLIPPEDLKENGRQSGLLSLAMLAVSAICFTAVSITRQRLLWGDVMPEHPGMEGLLEALCIVTEPLLCLISAWFALHFSFSALAQKLGSMRWIRIGTAVICLLSFFYTLRIFVSWLPQWQYVGASIHYYPIINLISHPVTVYLALAAAPKLLKKNMKAPALLAFLICVSTVCLLPSCKGPESHKYHPLIENAPAWGIPQPQEPEEPEPTVVFEDYTPKATFTTMASMEELIPSDPTQGYLGKVNRKFLKGCYYTGDTSTPFLASFAERWNRIAFLRRFVNAEEIFERENSDVGDSLTAETVRGKMPLLPNEYQLAFRNANLQARAKRLVRMLTTIDYVPEQTEKLASCFQELVNAPFDTPVFFEDADVKATSMEFWKLYDKSKYVENYEEILKKRLPEDVDYEELERLSLTLQKKYLAEKDFNAKCIYAIELGCYGFPDAIDYLGEIIEDGRYSKYLFEVWISWRLRAQSTVFGVSTYSEIPDNLYDNARLLVAQAYVNHLDQNPTDRLARFLLLNLIYTENLHRAGGYYGNAALGAELMLRTRYFLQDEEESSTK